MKPVKDTPFEFGYLASQARPPAWSLTVVVKATFTMVPDGTCAIADEQLPVTGDTYYDDDPGLSLQFDTDLAVLKPRAEFYVAGSCHPPGGRPVTSSAVSVQVGRVSKSLMVIGDRYWRQGVPSQPEPFTSMPLRYERSFGGPGFANNPVGLGILEVKTAAGMRRMLPNLENPRALISDPNQRPEPAGLFPYPPGWPQRTQYAGSFDERWLKTRWPALPADFQTAYFNAAPADQQSQGYYRGDEEIVLQYLHPDHPNLRTRLPGLVARVFLDVPAGGPEAFREVALQMDTIAIDAENLRVFCLWRGLTPVADDKLADIEHAFVMHEPFPARQHPDVCRDRMSALLAEETGVEEEADAYDVRTQMLDVHDPRAAVPAAPPAPDPVEEQLAGMAPADDAPGGPPGPTLSPSEALARMAAAGVTITEDMNALRSLEDPPTPTPPAPTEEERLLALRERVIAAHEAGESLAGEDLTDVDLSELSLPGIDLSDAILEGVHARRTNLDGANLEGATLGGGDLTGVWLRGAKLAKCDFSKAILENANLEAADLTAALGAEARMAGASLRHALLEGVDLGGADLRGVDFEAARCDSANFSNAKLEGARFVQSSLVSAAFEKVEATRAVFDDADLTKTNLSEGANFDDASFLRVRAKQANFAGARLNRADLTHGDFERANFAGAGLVQAKLNGCVLKSASFREAKLVAAEVLKSNAHDANFDSADLSHADLRGANLFGAELVHANTSHARLELANLTRTILA